MTRYAVPYDQWLVTHLDDACKVRQAKHWLLSKCNLVQSLAAHPHRRSVSPITFAPSVRTISSLDSLDDGYNEDDEHSDQDLLPRTPRQPHHSLPPKSAHPGSSPLVEQHTLLSFSTGALLEDEFALSWYNLRPYELLELHPVGTIAPLHRDVLTEYIQPYFHAKVRVLRALWNHRSGRFDAPGIDAPLDHGAYRAKDKLVHTLDSFSPKSASSQSEKRRRTRVDWKARWVVINQGILSLCKGHVTDPPLHQFALSDMRALRGADALERAFAIAAEPRVVCIKFRPRLASLPGAFSPSPSLPSSPISAESNKTNVQETVDPAPDTEQTTDRDDPCGPGTYEGEGTWIVLDMLDDHAFSSILRILHRQATFPLSSSFVPSSSIITVSHYPVPSSVVTPFASYDTIPYPEWRINTVENARKAGMGDVGKPMAWVIWTDKGLGDSLVGNIRHHRQAFSREMQYKTNTDIDSGPEDESDDESEMEWEGWMRDLERQSQVKQRSEKAGRSAASRLYGSLMGSSTLPSPPLSEASPFGSPRVRSPSLSHARYPNLIGNVIQSGGAHGYRSLEFPRTPDRIKSTTVSTVSVGSLPFSRRRSSTLTTDMAPTTRRDHDKGKQDREVFPSILMHGTRAPTRTVSVSAGQSPLPRTAVRQVHSSSNLRVSYRLDAPESPVHPGPSSPSKRQSAFMRGMSLRAGKIVRGLESAIDFVDEKTV